MNKYVPCVILSTNQNVSLERKKQEKNLLNVQYEKRAWGINKGGRERDDGVGGIRRQNSRLTKRRWKMIERKKRREYSFKKGEKNLKTLFRLSSRQTLAAPSLCRWSLAGRECCLRIRLLVHSLLVWILFRVLGSELTLHVF